jgi:hypothetical protein
MTKIDPFLVITFNLPKTVFVLYVFACYDVAGHYRY